MNPMNRRSFVQRTAIAGLAGTVWLREPFSAQAATDGKRRMTLDLVGGAIGVSANQREAIELAARHGFESVEAQGSYLAGLSGPQLTEIKALLQEKGLKFGASGLPTEFRRDEAQFNQGLKNLPAFAAGLKQAGVARVSTWIMPGSSQLTYLSNLKQHARRLRELAKILNDHDLVFGLEYVAPRTSWASQRYPFVHTLAEMKDLISEINVSNVGVVLDSWHWWHAGDTAADVLSLTSRQIVAVDLNDAPVGVPKDQMSDGKRELPCATGVINVEPFVNALYQVGYDGPVRAEPFNKALNDLPNDEACAVVIKALKKAIGLIHEA